MLREKVFYFQIAINSSVHTVLPPDFLTHFALKFTFLLNFDKMCFIRPRVCRIKLIRRALESLDPAGLAHQKMHQTSQSNHLGLISSALKSAGHVFSGKIFVN